MQYVTVGPREIYGLDPQNELNRCVKPCIGEWEKIPFDACEDEGGLKQMEATLNGVFAVTTSGSIYHYKTEVQEIHTKAEVVHLTPSLLGFRVLFNFYA